jgi:hypothetical protein
LPLLTNTFFFFIRYNLDAHNPHTPYSHHTLTHACASVHTQRRDWEATSPLVRGKCAIPPNTHACVYPEISRKIQEKCAIPRVDSIQLDMPTTGPQAHSLPHQHSSRASTLAIPDCLYWLLSSAVATTLLQKF